MTAKVLDGRYKLIKALGSGGFGRTYIARDMRRPGSPSCVVKHLQPASTDPGFVREARRLFNTEAETLEKLGNHDRIPQLLAYFEEEQQFYLVQEFIEGRSLQDEIQIKGSGREQRLSETEVIAMLRDVLNILDFVHSEGVIHRDLKPDNIIRRAKDGKLVLIDFGAVKAMQEVNTQLEGGESRFTVTIGTPGYMPSEQSMGRPNFTSDIFGLGMIAIHALTGLEPTDIPTDPLTGELIWLDRAKVTNLNGTLCEEIKISNGLGMVLTRMVRYQYAQRYQSAKEALQALSAFVVSSEPQTKKILMGTANPSAKVIKAQRRSAETASGLLIAGVVILGAATFLYVNSTLNKPSQPAIVVNPVPKVEPNNTPPPTPAPVVTQPPALTTFTQSLDVQLGLQVVKDGVLKPNQVLGYVFAGQQGQKLTTNITGEGILITILAPNGEPVDARAVQVSGWDGTLGFTGNYQIQLKPSSNGNEPDKPELKYVLSVLLNQDIPRVIDIPSATPSQ
jgi:serine/threonine protein kinase